MLRYSRFILLRSRNLIPPKNNIIQNNSIHLKLQRSCFSSLASSQRVNSNLDIELAEIFGASSNDTDLDETANQKIDIVLQKYCIFNLAECILNEEEEESCEIIPSSTEEELEKLLRSVAAASRNPRKKSAMIEEIDEILSLIPDFIQQHPITFFSQTLLFDFIKTSSLFGSKKALQVINVIQRLFPPGTRHFKPPQLLPLFENLFEKDNCDFPSASKVCNALISADLINDRRVFLEVAAKHLVSKLPYDDAFRTWSSSCSIDNIVSGGNIFLEHVLSNKKISIKLQERRINQLVKFYQRIVTPSDLAAQLIVSLVSTGRMVDAKILWYKLDIACKHFLQPVKKLKNDDDVDVNLVHIRDFAQLLEDCVLAELKPKKRKLSKKKNVEIAAEGAPSADIQSPEVPQDETESQLLTIPDGNMAFLLKEWQPFKKRTYKKQRIKKFEVKADQLEALVNAIQEVWVSLIELKNDPRPVGFDEIERFLERNKIPLSEKLQKRNPLSEKLQKRIEKLKEKQEKLMYLR